MNQTVHPHSRHLTASAVVFDRLRRLVLLVFHNGYKRWQLAGGHVEADETGAEAAIREVREETGVDAELWRVNPLIVPGGTWHPSPIVVCEFPHPGWPEGGEPAHHHIDELFLATADSTARTVAQLDEVDDVWWAPFDALDRADVRADVPVVVPYAWRILTGHPQVDLEPGS